MEVYIVTAYRWGDQAAHSYNLGVFNEMLKAIDCAESHCSYRGGKYACVVERCKLNEFNNAEDDYTKEVYREKSLRD